MYWLGKVRVLLVAMVLGIGFGYMTSSFAEESVKEEAKEVAHDTKRGLKKAGREIKDKTCEMVNGKMECAAKKVKHKIQNAGDKIEDAID